MSEELKFVLCPPKGTIFRECDICDMPYVYDKTSSNCLWCEINKEEKL